VKIKDKIEELEKRVRELEARPIYVPLYHPIYVTPLQPAPNPFYVQPPFITYTTHSPYFGTVTCGDVPSTSGGGIYTC
jgi:hypothetical protein